MTRILKLGHPRPTLGRLAAVFFVGCHLGVALLGVFGIAVGRLPGADLLNGQFRVGWAAFALIAGLAGAISAVSGNYWLEKLACSTGAIALGVLIVTEICWSASQQGDWTTGGGVATVMLIGLCGLAGRGAMLGRVGVAPDPS
ncbi:MAG: hypothetical protein FWD59_06740 [Micrococcales bacterium]|nr:hypothetical protein [Micrococcales bacterium]